MITEGTTAVPAHRAPRAAAKRDKGSPRTVRQTRHSATTGEAGGGQSPGRGWRLTAWCAVVLLWTFVTLSLLGYHPADPPAPAFVPHNAAIANWCGVAGAYASHFLFQVFAHGAWVLIGLTALWLAVAATGRRVGHLSVRVIGAILLAGTVAAFQAYFFPRSGPVAGLAGNLIGTVGVDRLTASFGPAGTLLVLVLAVVVGATVTLDVWALMAAAWTGRALYTAGSYGGRVAVATARAAQHRRDLARLDAEKRRAERQAGVRVDDLEDAPEIDDRGADLLEGRKPRRKAARRPAVPAEELDIEDPDTGGVPAGTVGETIPTAAPSGAGLRPASQRGSPITRGAEHTPLNGGPEARATVAEEEDDDTPGAPQVFNPDELRAKIAKLPVRFAAQTQRAATEDDLRDIQNNVELEGYRFPGLDLLEDPEGDYSETMETFVREQAEALERALKEYKIDGEVVGVESGPVITLYEVRLAPGTKVAALQAIASDLARSLKAINIRIVSNMAGRDTVGVEVPNAHKEKVKLKELMTKSEVYAKMKLPMFLGKDASGEPLICDLASMPHMLIAGTTGSGKSVCMNTIIMSFVYTKKPNELKLVLVDPKMVELSQFKDIPHLMCPVVTEMSKAAAILEWAVTKMDERYELLAEAGCRDISSYNELEWDELKDRLALATPEEEAKVPRKLPYMVFVIDELADLMMTNKEVEGSIVRIAQKARAVGIHLILATQRPQANVVTGLIKSNMPARCCFKVASGMDSRIVLDQKGGELLLGQGDMLYLSPRSSKLTRSQGTLVEDKEIRKVVKFMREVAAPTFERQLMQIRSGASIEDAEEGAGGGEGQSEWSRNGWLDAQNDELFDKAVEVVLENKRGSVSMLQRRLAIGYTRAARLIELMGEVGILGGHKGTVAREVVMTLEEWQAMKAQAAADAAAAAGISGGPDGELNSHPRTGETLEVIQARANGRGGDGGLLEEPGEAGHLAESADDDDSEEEDDGDDDLEGSDEAEEPPFRVETRTNRPGTSAL